MQCEDYFDIEYFRNEVTVVIPKRIKEKIDVTGAIDRCREEKEAHGPYFSFSFETYYRCGLRSADCLDILKDMDALFPQNDPIQYISFEGLQMDEACADYLLERWIKPYASNFSGIELKIRPYRAKKVRLDKVEDMLAILLNEKSSLERLQLDLYTNHPVIPVYNMFSLLSCFENLKILNLIGVPISPFAARQFSEILKSSPKNLESLHLENLKCDDTEFSVILLGLAEWFKRPFSLKLARLHLEDFKCGESSAELFFSALEYRANHLLNFPKYLALRRFNITDPKPLTRLIENPGFRVYELSIETPFDHCVVQSIKKNNFNIQLLVSRAHSSPYDPRKFIYAKPCIPRNMFLRHFLKRVYYSVLMPTIYLGIYLHLRAKRGNPLHLPMEIKARIIYHVQIAKLMSRRQIEAVIHFWNGDQVMGRIIHDFALNKWESGDPNDKYGLESLEEQLGVDHLQFSRDAEPFKELLRQSFPWDSTNYNASILE